MKVPLFRESTHIARSAEVPLPPLGRRIVWMAGIWVASVSVLLAVAMVLRWVLKT